MPEKHAPKGLVAMTRNLSHNPVISARLFIVVALFLLATLSSFAGEIIDNFDGQSLVRAWWAADPIQPYVYTLDVANTEHVHSAPYAMRIDFDKANDTNSPYSFLSASGRYNLSNYDFLSFWIYNNGSPLKIKVRFEDADGNPWESDWAGIFPMTKTAGADWENFAIDLTRTFSATNVDFTAIENIMFMVWAGSTTNAGTFWIDDLAATRAPNGAPLEPFESDFFGWSGGGVFSSMTIWTQEFQNSGTPMSLGQQSLKITWPSKSANYDNFVYTPFHDAAAPMDRIGRYTNFTRYGNSTVDLWVKSTTDNNFPILMKLTGSAGTNDLGASQYYTGNGAWQKMSWSFAAYSNVAATIQTVWIFPYPGASDNGGTMYIDNLGLRGGAGPLLPLAPTNFTTDAGNPDEDGLFNLQWSPVPTATNYIVQQDTDQNFSHPVDLSTTGTTMSISIAPVTGGETYYYRVCSVVQDSAGTFTAPLTIRVFEFPEAKRKCDVIADFDSIGQVAAWWGSDPDDPWVYQQDFESTTHVHSGEHAMHVVFDKANEVKPDGQGGVYTNGYSFFSAGGRYNFLNFDYLSFWVYNDGSPLRIKIRLEQYGSFSNAWETDWAGIFPQTETSAPGWENFTIDLTRAFYGHAQGEIDLTDIGQIMFMVEPGSETATGEFWMDDIELHRSPNSAPIEVFESDYYGWASGTPFVITNTTEDFYNDGSTNGLGQRSLKISWGAKAKNYSNITYQPDHDTNSAPLGRIGNFRDFSQFGNNIVELRIKSTTDDEIPILLKFDDNDVGFQSYTGSGAWQNVRWEFTETPGQTNVSQLFVIPYPNQADDGGVMFVDDLNLIGGSIPDVPYAPDTLESTADPADDDGLFDVIWSAVPGATSYELQEDTDPNFSNPVSLLTNQAVFSIAKDPLTENGTYYYRVRTWTAMGHGGFTAPIHAQVVPPLVEQTEMLDDFDGSSAISAWWGSDPNDPWVYQQEFENDEHAHSGDFSMKVVYDKSNEVRTNEFGELYTNAYSFMSASGLFNLENFDYLSFWVYNTGTPLRIKLRFEQLGSFSNAWETDWAGIYPQTVTTQADWENICIDLTRSFYGQANGEIDMSQIGQIMFMVEPGSETATGEFWMDDITLRRAPNSAPLEVYESDFYGWAAGTPFSITTTSSTCHNDGSDSALGQRSMEISWGPKAKNYSNITYQPEHDTNNAPLGRIGNYPDFTLNSNRYIELWVRSPTETNMPILLKFDDADVGFLNYEGTGEWQRLVWNYSTVAGATNVTQVFVIPYPDMADDGGVMYVDDLNLFGGTAARIPVSPPRFRSNAKDPDGDGVYEFRWDAVPSDQYELQEDEDQNFGSPSSIMTTATTLTVSKDPIAEAGTYYYRLRSLFGTTGGTFAAAIPVTVEYQPPAQLDYENLETFDGEKQVAFWWANDPTPPFCYTLDFGNTQHVHSGVVALKVDYDKANDENVYSFFSGGGLFNFRNHDYLSFWVYNDGSPLNIRIRLEDNVGGYFESNWTGADLKTRTPEADWENIVFDLSRTYSADSIDMTSVAQILFMVEAGNATNSGTFWLDDVQLQRAPNSAPIEPFEQDLYGWNGTSHFEMDLVPEAKYNDGSRTGIGQRGLRVAWTNKPKDYSSIQYDPGHDTNSAPLGRIGNYRDFTVNSNYLLEAWFKSETEFKMPILLKFDNADVGVQNYTGEGEWEKLTWDFSHVAGATNVGLIFFLPYPHRADAEGEFRVDDINLAGGEPPRFPETPEGVDAEYPNADGEYTVSWNAASNAVGYQILEANNADFHYPDVFYTTNLSMDFSHHPTNDGGTYYYRIRSYEVVHGVTNLGSFSISVNAYVPSLSTELGKIEDMSYETTCAEVDNLNIPLWHTNTSAYRITVTHPEYYPVTINERGADFDDCHFTDKSIWHIGDWDSSSAEFRQSGFGDGDEYYALDAPTAGVDEAWSEFPAALDSAIMGAQYIVFTAEEIGDVNLEPKIGSRLTVNMLNVTGTLEVKLSIYNGSLWEVVSNQVFDASHLVRYWNTPDFFWSDEVDANRLKLEIVSAADGGQTTAGACGEYDSLELWKRDEMGEFKHTTLYDDGNIIVEAIDIDFWWRAPDGMDVVTPQGTATNVEYFRIIKRVPDTNTVEYSQVFVMYEDGNVRLLPHPPAGVDWTPFGASVILGPTVEGPRPFAGIKTVTVNPKDISMDVVYDDGGSCHMDMWVDREKNVIDVSDIQYDTTVHPFARFRSMWTYDGKSDIDRAENSDGVFPVSEGWDILKGTWWKFFKEVPTYHNTYCPEFDIEVTDPIKAFLVRQAETLDEGSNYVVSLRPAGRGGEAISFDLNGGEASFDVYLKKGRPNTHMIIRYADDDGGNNGDYPGNLVQVYVDDVLTAETHDMNSGGWNSFDTLPSLELGDLTPGPHTIRIVVGGGTFGMDLDEFQLVSRVEKYWVRESVLTRQAETYDDANDVVDATRTGAVGGQSIHMELSNSAAFYNITLSAPVTQAYMRVRYSDDVGPTMSRIYFDDQITARFPTMDTGSWDDFGNSWELYMGDLAAGVHTVRLECSEETWGLDIDEFEIYTKRIQNRPPTFSLDPSYPVALGSTSDVEVLAYDLDGDDVSVSAVSLPAGAVFDGRVLAWTADMEDVGTTNPASFLADDGRSLTNSTASGSTTLVVPYDADADTLPDTWEWTNFTTLAYTENDDPDGDGAPNGFEYEADTSPTNEASAFVAAPPSEPPTNGYCVTVKTEPGRKYTIYFTDGMLGPTTTWRTFNDLSNGIGTWLETSSTPSQFTFVDDFTAATSGGESESGVRNYRVKTDLE